jgi:hypothetical protein
VIRKIKNEGSIRPFFFDHLSSLIMKLGYTTHRTSHASLANVKKSACWLVEALKILAHSSHVFSLRSYFKQTLRLFRPDSRRDRESLRIRSGAKLSFMFHLRSGPRKTVNKGPYFRRDVYYMGII